MQEDESKELIERIKKRDPAAFEQLVRFYEQIILRTAYRIVGQQSDAEEIRQIVLVRLWRSPESLPAAARFGSWIRRCVINESIAMLRRKERDRKKQDDLVVHRADESESETDLWSDESESLRVALNALSPKQRAVLSLRFDDQQTIRQIAQTLGMPHTTIQALLTRTISQLRGLLEAPHKQER